MYELLTVISQPYKSYQRDQYTLNPLNYVCYIVVYGIDPTTVGFLVQCFTKPKVAGSIPTAAKQFFSLARVDTLRVASRKNQIPEFKTTTTTRYGILYYHCHV